MSVSRALKFSLLFGVAALAVHTTMLLGERADGARALTLNESTAIWGAGGGCTGSKKADTWGCNDSGCTAVKNDTEDGGSDSKITSSTCTYTFAGSSSNCGAVSLAEKCGK